MSTSSSLAQAALSSSSNVASSAALHQEHRYLSWPYVPVPESAYYWGPVTASINWCEENYVVTRYIAEFCNTTTNGWFIVLAAIAIRNAVKYRYERRILFTSCGFLLVGIGSWLFHMTLKYEFQLLDELPMIYTTLIMFWGLYEDLFSDSSVARSPPAPSSSNTHAAHSSVGSPESPRHYVDAEPSAAARLLRRFFPAILAVLTFLIGAGITGYYLLRNKNPVFHEVAYAAVTAAVILRSWYLVHTRVSRATPADAEARRTMIYCTTLGSILFLGGFALWGIDNAACSSLTRYKHAVGLPWGFVLELHGWWHLLTGSGVALYIVFLTHLRLYLTQRHEEFEMQYALRFWPTLVRKYGYKRLDQHEA